MNSQPNQFKASVREIASTHEPVRHESRGNIPFRDHFGVEAHIELVENSKDCRSEVALSGEYISKSGTQLKLRGRIDILCETDSHSIITEFKTVVLPSGSLDELTLASMADFRLQASLYAYLLDMTYSIDDLTVPVKVQCEVKVLNLCDGEFKTWKFDWDRTEIENRLEDYIAFLEDRAAIAVADKARRAKLASQLRWPEISFHSGQSEMIQDIKDVLQQGANLLWQAPTGYGKTATMLYAALKHSLSAGGTLYYATAKGTGKDPVWKFVNKILPNCDDLRVLFIASRDDLCTPSLEGCSAEHCERRQAPIHRPTDKDIPAELLDCNLINEEILCDVAESHTLCPTELQQWMIERADLIVGDYNFVYDPSARLSVFRQPEYEHWTLLVDEAHNLVQRGQDIFSLKIDVKEINTCLQLLIEDRWQFSENETYEEMIRLTESLVETIQMLLRDVEGDVMAPIPPAEGIWSELSLEFGIGLGRLMIGAIDKLDPDLKVLLFEINNNVKFMNELLKYDRSSHVFYGIHDSTEIGIMCLDPADHFRHVNAGFGSVAVFSGSIQPFQYYRSALGIDDRSLKELCSSSIFPVENSKVVLAKDIDTRLTSRQKCAPEIGRTLAEFCSLKIGGYLAIFPSFKFIDLIIPYIYRKDVKLLVQQRGMGAAEIKQIMESLKSSNETSLALIVAGGRLAEAIDFTGDSCVGVAVVGPCLPPPSPFRQALRYYWQSMGEDGKKIAYIMPAMQKVIQAAGRMLRHKDERGVILLMDDRYISERYVDLLPEEWLNALKYGGNDWHMIVSNFWSDVVVQNEEKSVAD
jgi:DNA excision repair protein ERCC-2